MNCTVCGNPLLFDRVVFHCSCGAFVHAYCWNEHVLQAHQPTFEIGAVNLDGEFRARESKIEEQIPEEQISEEQVSGEQVPEEQVSGEQVPEKQIPGEQVPEEQVPGEQVSGEQVSGEQVSGEQVPEEQSSDEQITPLLE